MENWKNIKGYEGLYQVSDLGNIKRVAGYQAKNERILTPVNNGNNYWSVNLSKNGKKVRFYVHRIVADNFIFNTENKEEVNHIDGNRANNKLSNLEWVTRSENHKHRYDVLGQRGVNYGKTGVNNWNSKRVFKFDMNGNFLEEYPGVMEAMRITKIHESNIRTCIRGKSKSAGGFKWQYAK
jgi:hypothetical protein